MSARQARPPLTPRPGKCDRASFGSGGGGGHGHGHGHSNGHSNANDNSDGAQFVAHNAKPTMAIESYLCTRNSFEKRPKSSAKYFATSSAAATRSTQRQRHAHNVLSHKKHQKHQSRSWGLLRATKLPQKGPNTSSSSNPLRPSVAVNAAAAAAAAADTFARGARAPKTTTPTTSNPLNPMIGLTAFAPTATTLLLLLSAATLLPLSTATAFGHALVVVVASDNNNNSSNQLQHPPQQQQQLQLQLRQSPLRLPLTPRPLIQMEESPVVRSSNQSPTTLPLPLAAAPFKSPPRSSSSIGQLNRTANDSSKQNIRRRALRRAANAQQSPERPKLVASNQADSKDEQLDDNFDSDIDSKAATDIIRRLLASQLASLLESSDRSTRERTDKTYLRRDAFSDGTQLAVVSTPSSSVSLVGGGGGGGELGDMRPDWRPQRSGEMATPTPVSTAVVGATTATTMTTTSSSASPSSGAASAFRKKELAEVGVANQRASPLLWAASEGSDFGQASVVDPISVDNSDPIVPPLTPPESGGPSSSSSSATAAAEAEAAATVSGVTSEIDAANVGGAIDETVTCSPDYEDQAIIEASGSNLTAEQQQQLLAGADSSGLLASNGGGGGLATPGNSAATLPTAADFDPAKAGLGPQQTGASAGQTFGGGSGAGRQIALNGNMNNQVGQCVSPGNRMIEVITKIITPILFSIIIVVGLLGNIIVMLVILEDRKTERELTPTNLLILDLSLADLSFIIFCIPFTGWDYAIGHWVFGSLWCKFNQYLIVVCALSSIYTLVLMSIDRFLAIVYPIECMSYRTSKNMLHAIYIKWILILLAASPTILMHGLIDSPLGPEQFNCRFLADQHNPLHFQIVFFITSYLFPLILIFCLYLSLLNKLWFGSKPRGHRESVKMLESKKKVTWLVASIVIVFALCWCPIQVMLILMRLKSHKITATYVAIQVFAHTLGYTNSCINPIVYAFASETFHQSFKRSWLGRICLLCSRSSTGANGTGTTNNTQNNLSYYHTTTIMPRNSQNAYMHQLHQQQQQKQKHQQHQQQQPQQQQQQQLNSDYNNNNDNNGNDNDNDKPNSNRVAQTSCDDLHSNYLPSCMQKKNYNGNSNSNQTTGSFDGPQNNSSGKVQVTTTTTKATSATASTNTVQQRTNCYSNNITSSATVTTSSLNGNSNNNNSNSNNNNNNNSNNLKSSQSQNASQYIDNGNTNNTNNNNNQITSNSCDCCNQATTAQTTAAAECSDTGGCCCSVGAQQVQLRSLQDSTASNGTSCECTFIGHTDFDTSSCCRPYASQPIASGGLPGRQQPVQRCPVSSQACPMPRAALVPRQPTTTTNQIVGSVQQQQQQQQQRQQQQQSNAPFSSAPTPPASSPFSAGSATTTAAASTAATATAVAIAAPQLPAKQQLVARINDSGTQVAHQCEPCDLQQHEQRQPAQRQQQQQQQPSDVTNE